METINPLISQKAAETEIKLRFQMALGNPGKEVLMFANDLRHFLTLLFCLNFYKFDLGVPLKKASEEGEKMIKKFLSLPPETQFHILSASPLGKETHVFYYDGINTILPNDFIKNMFEAILNEKIPLSQLVPNYWPDFLNFFHFHNSSSEEDPQ